MHALICWLLGHLIPASPHPFWSGSFHAQCLRCGRECVGYYDSQFGDVDWRLAKAGWLGLPPLPKWRGW